MIPTIRTLLGQPALGLRLRAGADGLGREVRWVAVSELEDPTPYLGGQELVLTTGLRLDPDGGAELVSRLDRAGAAGLGLGVGLTHDHVPATMIAAADAVGLPLLEVPEPTPFIAVAKAVSEYLAAAEYQAVSKTVAAQRDLTRAALAPEGAAAVVAKLAAALEGGALLLDPGGALVHAAPRGVASIVEDLEPEVRRLRDSGPRSAAAFSVGEQGVAKHVVMQPLAPAGRVRGYLAVARDEALSAADMALVNVGAALVSLALERSVGTDTARRELRSAVFALLVDGIEPARLPIAGVGWDELLAGSVQIAMADGDSAAMLAVLEDVEEDSGGPLWRGALIYEDRLVVISAAQGADQGVDSFVELPPRAGLGWGISDTVAVTNIGDALRQARRALAAAGPGGTRRFADLARHGIVGLLDEDAGRGFADGLLGPLEARDRGDLVASVRAWLAHHGQLDAAAQSLGIHRHTLRYRMRRVEELVERPLDDPDLRAELWVALAIRDRDAES